MYKMHESNLAGEAVVVVSSECAGYEGIKAIDGIWGQCGPNGGEWASEETNPWIALSWKDEKSVGKVILYDRVNANNNTNRGILAFSDGSSMSINGIPTDGTAKEIAFDIKHNIKWIKFQMENGTGQNAGLAEIKVFGTPVVPREYELPEKEIDMLINRLDRDNASFAVVFDKFEMNDKPGAAEELLKYYKSRTSVWHTIERSKKKSSLGNYAEHDFFVAGQDQLRKVFTNDWFHVGHPMRCTFLGENIDWFTNISGAHFWTFYLNGHKHFHYLIKSYWHTGDEDYVKEWADEFLDWCNKRPVEYSTDDSWDACWAAYSIAYRLSAMTSAFQHFIDSPSFTKGILVRFLNSVYDHMEVLKDNYSPRILTNFTIYEAFTASEAVILFPEFIKSKDWRDKAINVLTAQIKPYPDNPDGIFWLDGVPTEETLVYHWGMIQGILLPVTHLYENNNYSDFDALYFKNRIVTFLEVLMKTALPDGLTPRFGDDGICRYNIRDLYSLLKGEKAYDRPDLNYVYSGYEDGAPPVETACMLPDGGFYSMRSGWNDDAICLVLKCGPNEPTDSDSLEDYMLSGNHCSRDNCSFELSAGGTYLMPASGSYTYNNTTKSSRRAWYRQTKVKQTLTINAPCNEISAVINGSFTNGQPIEGTFKGIDWGTGIWKAGICNCGISGVFAYVDSTQAAETVVIELQPYSVMNSVTIYPDECVSAGKVTLSSIGNEPVEIFLKSRNPVECITGWKNAIPDGKVSISINCIEGIKNIAFDKFTYGSNNSYFAPSLLLWKPGPELDTLVVENQSYTALKHRRTIHFVKKRYFIIIDEAIGAAEGEVDVHFQLAPPDNADYGIPMTVRTLFKDKWNVLVKGLDTVETKLITEEGWFSPEESVEERRPAFAFRKNKIASENIRFVSLVIPYEGKTPPKAAIQPAGGTKPGADVVEMHVSVGNDPEVNVGYDLKNKKTWIVDVE